MSPEWQKRFEVQKTPTAGDRVEIINQGIFGGMSGAFVKYTGGGYCVVDIDDTGEIEITLRMIATNE